MKNHIFFVTGIGTDVGKTVVSSILVQAFEGTYLKPVQAGDVLNSDSITVKRLTTNTKVLDEFQVLSQPMSPHAAAKLDNVQLDFHSWQIPVAETPLIIEGAGGFNVPISDTQLFADWLEIEKLNTIVVSRNYLGSINHTLLTLEVLKNRKIPVEGVIFVGEQNLETERAILNIAQTKKIFAVPHSEIVDSLFIDTQAKELRKSNWFKEKKDEK